MATFFLRRDQANQLLYEYVFKSVEPIAWRTIAFL
jgi:hypothetical protein